MSHLEPTDLALNCQIQPMLIHARLLYENEPLLPTAGEARRGEVGRVWTYVQRPTGSEGRCINAPSSGALFFLESRDRPSRCTGPIHFSGREGFSCALK